MNEQFDSNGDPLHSREEDYSHRRNGEAHARQQAQPAHNTSASGLDFWTVADLLFQRWHWVIVGGIIGAAIFFELGWKFVKPKFTATTQLLRYETPATSEALKTPALTPETFAGLIASPDLLARVGEKTKPPIAPEILAKLIKVDMQPDSDIVKILVASRDPWQAVDLANLYASETEAYTKARQARQAGEVANNYLKKQVAEMDQDIVALQEQFRAMPTTGPVSNKLAQISGDLNTLNQNLAASPRPTALIAKLQEQLQAQLIQLATYTAKYTDANPLLQDQKALVQSLREQISAASTNSAYSGGLSGQMSGPDYEIIQTRLRSLEDARVGMANRQREAQLYATNPPGSVSVLAPATLKTVQSNHRRFKIGLLSIFGSFLGMGSCLFLILMAEAVDNRLKTAADVRRVTRLPVLTTLGHLERMQGGSRAQWAFRTWTLLQGRLSRSQNHGLVCGFTSSVEGEGRSTWISLLAEAASLSGFRVLTIATKPSSSDFEPRHELSEGTLDQLSEASQALEHTPPSNALSHNVLATPSEVTDQLTDPNAQPVVHIPLPGWVWNLERRKQWRDALDHWRKIDNLVIFVELPPASVPEAVLLGANLPNLLWLSDSGKAQAAETRTQLETLRHARCNLVGAVLNRELARPIRRHFSRWLVGLSVIAGALHSNDARAQTNTALNPDLPPAITTRVGELRPTSELQLTNALETNEPIYSLSGVAAVERADWQKRLTLGAGDVVTLGMYGDPLLTKTEVAIGPDGRLTYLEAHDVLAAGLTVDELRSRLDEEIGKYRRSARTIITPMAYRSKKYYVLGKVVQRGVYTLDRPTTVVEALARAHGIENGLVDNNNVDLADVSRSFLSRNGKRIPLNFERLIQNGDLSQNIQIEPNDYLFFPSANIKQVYVLGEVSLPGLVTYRPDLTAVAAISERGGFNQRAYKGRVLIIRGSINHPETFIVDVLDVVNGRAPDFKLEPKDIVYVSYRPFFRAEELLDLALTAFIQAIIASATGVDGINVVFP
jgi:protein involved in polysaccharide export with SLBB domain/capsular polysaccharide biosynthesis protein